jgi:hypothetical protein
VTVTDLQEQISRLQRFLSVHGPARQEVDRRINATGPKKTKRSRMSAAARKAVSVRMTRYWAARRKAKR